MSKYKVSLISDSGYVKNNIFDISVTNPINRDDGLYCFYLLKEELLKNEIDLSTADINLPNESDIHLYFDMPQTLRPLKSSQKRWLVIFESELIKPRNWDKKLHAEFDKIFTWHSDFIDHDKYIRINFSHKLKMTGPPFGKRSKFCCLIAGHKSNLDNRELYSKRVEAIRWFERNHPTEFDLYGVGWDEYQFQGPLVVRALNRLRFLKKVLAPKFPSYRGRVQEKLLTLREYQFSICYENAHSIPGYVTEKVFDSLFAGCIPIYWGAPDIEKYLPKDCFIDFRDFENYENLYKFLISLKDQDIQNYQQRIFNYLQSDQVTPYTAEYFAQTIATNIVKVLS